MEIFTIPDDRDIFIELIEALLFRRRKINFTILDALDMYINYYELFTILVLENKIQDISITINRTFILNFRRNSHNYHPFTDARYWKQIHKYSKKKLIVQNDKAPKRNTHKPI